MDELLERFQEGAPLSMEETYRLRRETDLTKEQWDEYYERFDKRRKERPGGWGFGDVGMYPAEKADEDVESEDTDDE